MKEGTAGYLRRSDEVYQILEEVVLLLERMVYEAFKISGERIAERVIEAVIINICTMTIRDMIKDMKEKKKVEIC